jgi:hypothetical protein
MKEHPMEVLGYAVRHGYREIRDQAAPLSLDETFDLARKSLSMEALIAWVRAGAILLDRRLRDRSKLDSLTGRLS